MPRHYFPTLHAVAREAKVSTAAASFTLNGKGNSHRISKETQERVLKAAEELNYQPNPLARNLRRKQSTTIGVLWGFSGPHLSNSLVQCFTSSAMALGYNTLVYDTTGTLVLIKKQLRQLLNWRIQGVIMLYTNTTARHKDAEIIKLLHKIPHVLLVVDEPLDLPFQQIVQSRRKAIADAVKGLVSNGRKKFAYIGTADSTQDKIIAIHKALDQYPNLPALHILNHPRSDNLDRTLIDPLINEAVSSGIDAIFTTTDEMAALTIGELRRRKINVPRDIAIVGFNDSPFASLFDPPIASIRRFDADVCTYATQCLIETIKEPTLKISKPKKFEMQFIPRLSATGRTRKSMPGGFTLMEILVVAVLILTLAAAAIPTINAIQKQSTVTRCVSNLRQIGMAMAQYSSDNDNCLPINEYPGKSWHTKVDSYLGCNYGKIWNDPETVRGTPLFCPDEKSRPLTSPYATYSINRELYLREDFLNPPKKLTALVNPSKYVLLSDGHDAVIYTDQNQKMVEWTKITRYHDGHPHFLYADWHVERFYDPIVGLLDPGGQSPDNRMRWEALYSPH